MGIFDQLARDTFNYMEAGRQRQSQEREQAVKDSERAASGFERAMAPVMKLSEEKLLTPMATDVAMGKRGASETLAREWETDPYTADLAIWSGKPEYQRWGKKAKDAIASGDMKRIEEAHKERLTNIPSRSDLFKIYEISLHERQLEGKRRPVGPGGPSMKEDMTLRNMIVDNIRQNRAQYGNKLKGMLGDEGAVAFLDVLTSLPHEVELKDLNKVPGAVASIVNSLSDPNVAEKMKGSFEKVFSARKQRLQGRIKEIESTIKKGGEPAVGALTELKALQMQLAKGITEGGTADELTQQMIGHYINSILTNKQISAIGNLEFFRNITPTAKQILTKSLGGRSPEDYIGEQLRRQYSQVQSIDPSRITKVRIEETKEPEYESLRKKGYPFLSKISELEEWAKEKLPFTAISPERLVQKSIAGGEGTVEKQLRGLGETGVSILKNPQMTASRFFTFPKETQRKIMNTMIVAGVGDSAGVKPFTDALLVEASKNPQRRKTYEDLLKSLVFVK